MGVSINDLEDGILYENRNLKDARELAEEIIWRTMVFLLESIEGIDDRLVKIENKKKRKGK